MCFKEKENTPPVPMTREEFKKYIEFIKESQRFLSEQYAKDAESWGVMKDSVWDGYTEFMAENGLIEQTIPAADQYTNEFVQ